MNSSPLNTTAITGRIDEALGKVAGAPQRVLLRELKKEFRELQKMYLFNHAVLKYAKEVQA